MPARRIQAINPCRPREKNPAAVARAKLERLIIQAFRDGATMAVLSHRYSLPLSEVEAIIRAAV
jgi:hypothetical protein